MASTFRRDTSEAHSSITDEFDGAQFLGQGSCKVTGIEKTPWVVYDKVLHSSQTNGTCPMQATTVPFVVPLPTEVPFAFSLHAVRPACPDHPRRAGWADAALTPWHWAKLGAAAVAHLFRLDRPICSINAHGARSWGGGQSLCRLSSRSLTRCGCG